MQSKFCIGKQRGGQNSANKTEIPGQNTETGETQMNQPRLRRKQA